VVIVYSIGLIKPAEFRAIIAVRRTEFVWALVAFAGVVLLGTLQGILVAIVVSLMALAHQVSDPPVYVLGRKPGSTVFRPVSSKHPDDEVYPGLLMLRPEGRMFFANVGNLGQKVLRLIEQTDATVIAIHMRVVFDLEYTALKALIEAEKKMSERGMTLWLVGLNPGVLSMVRRSPLGEALGPKRMFYNLDQAVTAWLAQSPERSSAKAPLGETL
jgi:sulfate permease, SulP family